MAFRTVLFWIHLFAGLVSGLVIGVMCLTGAALAFEKEIIAWAESDVRRIEAPAANAPRLTLSQLQEKLQVAHPDARPASIVLQNDPGAAIAFSVGRVGGFYANPYTGQIRRPESTATARFMQMMITWHRYLGFNSDANRPHGKLINGICNAAFCGLAITGLYLWFPRTWSWRALRPVVWFRQNASPKARHFNWHNTIGVWCAPILIVLTLTALPISFRWAGNVIFTLTGTPPPTAGSNAPRAAGLPPASPVGGRESGPPTTGLPLEAFVAVAQTRLPRWETLTVRLPTSPPTRLAEPPGNPGTTGTAQPSAERNRRAPEPITIATRESGTWPRTATTTLTFDPLTAAVVQQAGYAEMSAAQQVRSWTRFLHTGEAVGTLGQLIAGLACVGGLVLVYSGFALSWHRFFGRKNAVEVEPDVPIGLNSRQPPNI